MAMGRRFAVAAAAAVMMVLGLGAVPAQAVDNDCPAGYACAWDNTGYNDSAGWYAVQLNAGTYSGIHIDNTASSLWANGSACERTSWYISANRTGTFMWLSSEQWDHNTGEKFNDGTLNDGVNESYPSSAWDDPIWSNSLSSWQFTSCIH